VSFAVNHMGISCADPPALEAWYTKHFGFRRKRVYLPGPDQVVVIGNEGASLELFPA
jgi:glyoxylase I family protein